MSTDLKQKAIDLATAAHAGQIRKYVGEPYVNHPIRVAERVARVPGATEQMVAAAVLHDVLEDTDLTFADLVREVGVEVAVLVDGCTDKFTPETFPANRKARKKLEAERLGREPREVQIIKLADVADNLVGTDPADSFSEVFLREKEVLMTYIGGADEELRAEVEAAGAKLRAAFETAKAAKVAG